MGASRKGLSPISPGKNSSKKTVFGGRRPPKKISNFKNIISYNIAPSQNVNIIINNKSLNIEAINWGLQFFDKKNNQIRNVINSRLETVHQKILFKESYIKKDVLYLLMVIMNGNLGMVLKPHILFKYQD